MPDPALTVSQIWNDASVTFTALLVDVTNIASGPNSNLIDCQVNGLSVFNVTRQGVLRLIRQTEATNSGPSFIFRKRGNVGDATGAVLNGASLGTTQYSGWNGTAFYTSANIIGSAEEDWDSSKSGSLLSFQVTPVGTTSTVNALQLRGTSANFPAGIELQTAGYKLNHNLAVYAAGTEYVLTTSLSGVVFGTTSPILVLDKPGTYRLTGQVKLELNGATFNTNQTVTVKIRRTNPTADIPNSVQTFTVPVVVTQTNTLGIVTLPEVFYTTVSSNESLQIFASVSEAPSAGTISISSANISATRLY